MSPRNRHYGGDPSPHDSTGPRNKGDISRPLGAPPPAGGSGGGTSGCAVLILLCLSLSAVGLTGLGFLAAAIT